MTGRRARLLFLTAAVVVAVAAVLIVGRGSSGSRSSLSAGAGATLAVGATAPTGSLTSTRGDVVDLAGFRGRRAVLLYFYEHAG